MDIASNQTCRVCKDSENAAARECQQRHRIQLLIEAHQLMNEGTDRDRSITRGVFEQPALGDASWIELFLEEQEKRRAVESALEYERRRSNTLATALAQTWNKLQQHISRENNKRWWAEDDQPMSDHK